jgi:hypothetical protein
MLRRMEHGEHYTTARVARRLGENGSTSNLGLVASLHLSAEVSPANPIALQENVRRLVMSVIYGASAPGSQMSLDPAGASLKTCRDYFRANAAASSPAWSVTWPRWGIASDGVFGELATLEHRTAANESSLSRIPTPQARDWKGANQNAECATGDGACLPNYVRKWPTPTGRDHKDGSAKACANVPPNGLLGRVVHGEPDPTGSAGALSPQWVEWLQGFPDGWTDLEPSETP